MLQKILSPKNLSFLASSLLLSGSAFSNQLNCWDGSFVYNTAQVETSAHGHKVIFSGPGLTGDPLWTVDGIKLELGEPGSGEFFFLPTFKVMMQLPLGSCQFFTEEQRVTCELG